MFNTEIINPIDNVMFLYCSLYHVDKDIKMRDAVKLERYTAVYV